MGKREVVLYIGQSLDGFIATKEDGLDWLFSVEGEGDNGFGAFYDTVDTILMGRRTYDWIMEQEKGRFPYEGKRCFVVSGAQHEDTDAVRFLRGDIAGFVRTLQEESGKRIWLVGGAQLIRAFRQAQLIDTYILNIAPVLIGTGIPLFTSEEEENLRLDGVQTFGQFVELTYRVIRSAE